jgi:hypothetical protein
MALTGTLQDFNLFSIFTMIKTQNKTGTLTVENESIGIKLVFDNGGILEVVSSEQNAEDDILSILLRLGIISNTEFQNMHEIRNQTLKSIKKIALEHGAVTLKNIQDAYQMQAMIILYQLFLWTNADYRFDSIIADDIDRDVFLPLPIESVLMETAKFIDEWPRVQRQLPSISQTLAVTAKEGVEAANLLTHEERTVLGYFGHPNSIQDAIKLSRYYELDTCKCIVTLLEQGHLEISDQKTTSAHPVIQGISDIQKKQRESLQTYSPFFWPILAICAIVSIFFHAPKMLGCGANGGQRSINDNSLVPLHNWQIEERRSLVSILKNANTNSQILTIAQSPSQNSMISNEAKDAFEKYSTDPMQPLLQNERREPRR